MRINNTDTLQSNKTNKSVNNTIILSSCDYSNNITKTASTTNLASLETKISNEESLAITNNQETNSKFAHPECKKIKASNLTDNGEVDLTQLNENSLCSEKTNFQSKKWSKKIKTGHESPSGLSDKGKHDVPTQTDTPKQSKHSKDSQELHDKK